MVESMIGLLRQDQSFILTTRCYEGLLSDAKIPSTLPLSVSTISVISLLSTSLSLVLILPNNSPCDTVFTRLFLLFNLFRCLHYLHFHWLLLAAKEAETSSVCES
ncbi:Uncharacterised protein [Yersinia rohdei]|uniref:Uncharacterized protein n=1 Tax=Yersinia rohdei TaxID=29485 RepID=A0A0U1HTD3_YERRO|nr:Uncharacterised protein [Yersinia rohdei]